MEHFFSLSPFLYNPIHVVICFAGFEKTALTLTLVYLTVNLGKWVLRYLFDGLIQEEIERDAEYRKTLKIEVDETPHLYPQEVPDSASIPTIVRQDSTGRFTQPGSPMGMMRAPNGAPLMTPGLSIGVGTPNALSPFIENPFSTPLAGAVDDTSGPKDSPGSPDYFSPPKRPSTDSNERAAKTPTATEDQSHSTTTTTSEPEKEEKTKRGAFFGKKFQMNFPKKLARPSTETKPIAEEKEEESDKSSEKEKEKLFDDNIHGVIEKIRADYDVYVAAHPGHELETLITPTPEIEAPVLNLSPQTAIIIQEENRDSAVAADLYRGTIATVRENVDEIEKAAPTWLGEFLLRVCTNCPAVPGQNYLKEMKANLWG